MLDEPEHGDHGGKQTECISETGPKENQTNSAGEEEGTEGAHNLQRSAPMRQTSTVQQNQKRTAYTQCRAEVDGRGRQFGSRFKAAVPRIRHIRLDAGKMTVGTILG